MPFATITFYAIVFFLCLYVKAKPDFEPYKDNSGTVVGIAGKTFCILAADSRLSEQYMIHSRNFTRIFEVTDELLVTGTGCLSDLTELTKLISNAARSYQWSSDKQISVESASFLLSRILYQRRTFPFFTFCGLAGISKGCGSGVLYRYDAIGSAERVKAFCSGKGEQLIQPFLDEITNMEEDPSYWKLDMESSSFVSKEKKNILGDESRDKFIEDTEVFVDVSKDKAIELVQKAFLAAAERDITVGDGFHLWIIETDENKQNNDKNKCYNEADIDAGIHLNSDGEAEGSLRSDVGQHSFIKSRRSTRIMTSKLFFGLPRH